MVNWLTIQDGEGDRHHVTRPDWNNGLPAVWVEKDWRERWLGYWESGLEVADWACEALDLDPYACTFTWERTGEVITYEDLIDEYLDELDELDD